MVYNIPQFRKELKDAFDKILQGEEVYVQRSGVIFKIEAVNVAPTTQKNFMPPLAGKLAKEIEQETLNAAINTKIEGVKEKMYSSKPIVVCKSHGIPVQEGRKTCMMKGCK